MSLLLRRPVEFEKGVEPVRFCAQSGWRMWRALMALGVVLIGAFGVKSASGQCNYSIVAEISTPGCFGDDAPIIATAISDQGVVVGYFIDCAFNEKPFMWSEEMGFVAIPLPPDVARAEPEDVNNDGEIVGRLFRAGGGMRAFRYMDGIWTELPPTGDGIHSETFGVNDDGWACGYRDTSGSSADRKAFRWMDDAVEELSSLIRGEDAVAQDINRMRDATGTFGGLFSGRAFLWHGDRVELIEPPDGANSSDGRAINNKGEVTGQSLIDVKEGSVPRLSWIFENGVLTDLGSLPGADHRTIAFDLNDAGQIVGRSEGLESPSVRPFLWQHGEIMDLRLLVVDGDDLFLRGAAAINNTGQIVVDDPANLRWVVLAPLDRPPGDVNIDCTVDEFDLIAVLDDWGPDKLGHPTDMVSRETFAPPGDGHVDAADLAFVLGNWSTGSQSLPVRR